jgi:hypothetical protein
MGGVKGGGIALGLSSSLSPLELLSLFSEEESLREYLRISYMALLRALKSP